MEHRRPGPQGRERGQRRSRSPRPPGTARPQRGTGNARDLPGHKVRRATRAIPAPPVRRVRAGLELLRAASCGFAAPHRRTAGWNATEPCCRSAQYPALHAAIGTTYGGNGTTTFALPDLTNNDAGLFIRAATASRQTGTVQGDAMRQIKGSFGQMSDLDYSTWSKTLSGPFGYKTNAGISYPMKKLTLNTYTATSEITFDTSAAVPTAEENRPVNIALMPLIKY